jgi:hypothetical protein
LGQLKIYLPPPSNWQDFQDLVAQIASMQYVPESVQQYGRQGQRQNGIDIFAENGAGQKIGIQCKETKKRLDKQEIENEAKAARGFTQKLDLFIIATTQRSDARLLDSVMELNNCGQFSFTIRIEFWDDFQHYLNQCGMVLNSCYDNYRKAFEKTDESHHLECLGAAFNRPAFRDDFLHERNYEDFGEALAETMRLFSIGIVRDRWSSIGIIQTAPLRSLPDGEYKSAVKKIDDMLSKMYQEYIADAKNLSRDHRYAQDRAGHYNIARRRLLNHLNKMLTAANLQPIAFQYA